MDDGFIGRVYRSSAYVGLFGVLAAWSIGGPFASAGWTMGALVSFGVLWSLEWVVRRAFVPGEPRARRMLTRFSLLKLPALLVILGLAVWIGRADTAFILAFCAGLLLTQAVIIMKALGIALTERMRS